MGFLAMLLPLVLKYGPELEADIVNAVHKAGYTVAQIDSIFAQVKPYDQLGINPNAPVQPDTGSTPPPPNPLTPPTA